MKHTAPLQRRHKTMPSPSRRSRPGRFWVVPPLAVLAGAAGLIVAGTFFSLQATRASLEAPPIDSTNLVGAEFRSVYSYYRGDRLASEGTLAFNDPNNQSGAPNEFFEAIVVGKNNDATAAEQGVVYTYDGERVKRNTSPGFPYTKPLNDVAGQFNFGTGNSHLWMVGDDGYVAYNPNSTPNAGFVQTSQVITNSTCSGFDPNLTSHLYAVAAPAGFRVGAMAGGQDGLLLLHTGYLPERWKQLCTSIPDNHTITDIAVTEGRQYYFVTAAFGATSGVLDRNATTCTESRLYKFLGEAANNTASLQLIGSRLNSCFFGLTAIARDPDDPGNVPGTNGNPYNIVWIATSNGVLRYDERAPTIISSSAPLPGTSGKIFHSVAGVNVQRGNGENLLFNGSFAAWEGPNPSSDTVNPTGWVQTDDPWGFNDSTPASCGTNEADGRVSTDTPSGTGYSLLIEPKAYYLENTCGTVRYDNAKLYFAQVDLSRSRASRFKVSGQVKVEFTEAQGAQAPFPQGGVSIGCPGGSHIASPKTNLRSLPECSFANRSQIYTVGNPTNGWKSFELIISNQNAQYSQQFRGLNGNPRTSNNRAMLQIVCEATKGAKVWCDDLRVEPIDDPVSTPEDRYEILAVGRDGVAMFSDDAAGAASFRNEENEFAAAGAHLYSASAADQTFYYTAGPGTSLFQRAPTNLTGYIWAGTASPVSAATKAGLGWISTGCANSAGGASNYCDSSPAGFGLSIENNQLIGRAWMGKNNSASYSDSETINLGQCVGAARASTLSNAADGSHTFGYGPCTDTNDPDSAPDRCAGDLSRTCTQANQVTACKMSCNPSTRTCVADSSKSCISDFDCLGRCEKDQGFACAYDADCQVAAADEPTTNVTLSGTNFSRFPKFMIQCALSGASANACAAGGWLSFNPVDYSGTTPGVDVCGTRGACLSAHRLQGWGRFLTLADSDDPNGSSDRGWVRLRGNASGSISYVNVGANQGLVACQACTQTGTGNNFACQFCQDRAGRSCTTQSQACTYFCHLNGTPHASLTTCKNDTDCATLGDEAVCQALGRCSEDASISCSQDSQCAAAGNKGYCAFGAFCPSQATDSCQEYGVNYDGINERFSGYAWSSDYGWLDFRNVRKGTGRFIQTRLGDVYSQRRIGDFSTQPAPGGLCNATYVVSATGSINNFCSSFDTEISYDEIQSGAQFIPFAQEKNRFATALGKLDIEGLETPISELRCVNDNFVCTTSNDCTQPNYQCTAPNKYGAADSSSTVLRLGWQETTVGGITYRDLTTGVKFDLTRFNNSILYGSVMVAGPTGDTGRTYRINRDLRFKDTADFLSGVDFVTPGHGALIVNGNLRINGNITYGTSTAAITDIRQIPSLLVVVRGDLIIDTKVTNLVGAYYVTGTVCTSPNSGATACPSDPNPGTTPNSFPLTVRGLMIAKKFVLERTFSGLVTDPQPSELFVFDGRIQANPLPGTTDFANALPSGVNVGP